MRGNKRRTTPYPVMVDTAGFRLYNPESKLVPEVDVEVQGDNFTNEDYLICSPAVLGFSFKHKKWRDFDVSRLEPFEFSGDAFASLVIDSRRKTVIKSLVEKHSQTSGHDDLVKGKGQGLIGLFAGGPGCGKTLTVEAVAQETKKPLYMVSAGELGSRPTEVDTRLSNILDLAYRWDAIVLLDEADVFLQRRSGLNVFRDEMVSIFLRQLEYFKGIMVLTTNRVDDCDPAFEIRIHFSMHFEDLGFEARRMVWKTFLRRVEGSKNVESTSIEGHEGKCCRICGKALDSEVATGTLSSDLLNDGHLDILAGHSLNGRQIQNTVRTANTLAQAEGEPLAMSHLQGVLEVRSAWTASRSEVDVPKLREGTKEQAYSPARFVVELATGRIGWRVLLEIFLLRILSLLNAKQRN